MDLRDKVALVTGAAKRVGRAIALEFARRGCHVAVHHRASADQARQVAAEIDALGRRAILVPGDLAVDATWSAIVEQTVESLGRLDLLVNNASLFESGRPDTLDAFDADLWERMLRINLIAPVALAHHARARLAATGTGKVINLTDSAVERPWRSHLAYGASKAALAAMTKALAKELAPAIQVNAVAPGIAVFPESYSPQLRKTLVDRVPLRREGTPEEVARLVRFLAEEGDYITGQIIAIDGGRNAL